MTQDTSRHRPSRPPGKRSQRRSVAALTCAIALQVLAVDVATAQRYHVRVYGAADGLPTSHITDIAQDSTGTIWLANHHQLVSYDGFEWSTHHFEQAMPEDHCHVRIDARDRVWVLSDQTRHSGSIRIDGRWNTLPPVPDREVGRCKWKAATLIDRDGESILLATVDGLGTFTCDAHDWTLAPWSSSIDPSSIRCLLPVGDELLVGTTRGAYRVAADFVTVSPIAELGEAAIQGLALDTKTAGVWVLGSTWLGRLLDGRLERVVTDDSLPDDKRFVGPVVDWLGGVYFGTFRRLLRFDPSGRDRRMAPDIAAGLDLAARKDEPRVEVTTGAVEAIGRRSGPTADGASALFIDREGNVWVGNRNTVSKIVSLSIATYDMMHGLPEPEVTSILQRRTGDVVLGHSYSLTILSPDGELTRVELGIPPAPGTRLLDLEEDPEGNLWMAAHGKGLGKLDAEGALTWTDLNDSQPDRTTSVVVDSLGRLWVADSQRLFRREGDRFVPVSLGSERRGYLRKLFRGTGGRIYVTTNASGVLVLEEGSVRRVEAAEASDANDVYAVLEDRSGRAWLGTGAGLFRVEGDAIAPPPSSTPRLDRPIYSLLVDRNDRLWCGTNDGVFRLDEDGWTHLTVEDGFAGRETNRDAALVDDAGDVWFGTEDGVSVYRSGFEIDGRPAPTVHLTAITIDGVSFPPSAPCSTDGDKDHVLFQFRGISFVDEDRIEFRYRLRGFERVWQGPMALPSCSVRYTSLRPGRYVFELQARGHHQPWSEVVTSATLEVPRPLTQRPWFVTAALVVGGAFLLSVSRLVARHRYTRHLEREVERRLEENRELEAQNERARKLESLGVLAGGIAHDFNNLLTVIKGSFDVLAMDDSLSQDDLAVCTDGIAASDRAQALTRQLLTFSRGGAPVLRTGDIRTVLRESISFVMRGSDLAVETDLPSDLWMVDMDADQISQVIGNLLLNAKQASRAGGAIAVRGRNLTVDDTDRQVEIEVVDHGDGIEPDQLGRVFDPYYSTKPGGSGLGLATSYSIVRRHGGSIDVSSRPGHGSTFRVLLPASRSAVLEEEAGPPEPHGCGPQRVLVMDDDDAVRQMIMRMVERLGHVAEAARDGAQTLGKYELAMRRGEPFDVVLMDLTIRGGMGGKEAIGRLLAIDPDARAIVLSGYSNDLVLSDCARFGFVAALSKPVSIAQLGRTLAEVLEPDVQA